jgi:hypothetical protein
MNKKERGDDWQIQWKNSWVCRWIWKKKEEENRRKWIKITEKGSPSLLY